MHELLDEIYCEILEQGWMNGKAGDLHRARADGWYQARFLVNTTERMKL